MDFFSLKPLTSLPAPAFSDAAGAQAWLVQQKRSPGRFFDAAVEQLERLQGLRDNGFTRAQILETLRHDTLVALAANRQRFAWHPRPLKPVNSAALNSNLRLWSAMSTGYMQCTEGLAASPGTDPAWVAVAAHRAMTAVKLAIEDHFFAGVEPPALLWQRALAIAQMTQAFGISDLPVADPCMPDLGQSTSIHQYAILALTAFADPFSTTATEYAMLQRLLIRWRDLPKLAATRGVDDKERWIDLRQLEQPSRDASKDPAWMEISLVRSKIKKRAEALETGETPDNLHLGKDLSGPQWIAMLNRVRRKWRDSYEPPSPHDPKAAEIVFVTGTVEDGFGLITGFRYNANPKAGAASDKVLHERMAIFGRNSIISDLASEKPKLGEEWSFGFEDENGLRISCPVDAVRLGIQVGQLVTIKRGSVPQLGKVARAVTRQNGRMEATIHLFQGAPVAAEAHALLAGGQLHYPALLLPPVPEIQQPMVAFLDADAQVSSRLALQLNLQNPKQIVLGPVLDRGPNHQAYRIDNTR
jgi:hypothetical protein